MAHSDGSLSAAAPASLPRSVFRSVFTHYWMFTAYVLAYATAGLALASISYGWSWTLWGVVMATLWFGLEGLHAVDLSDSDIATNIDPTIQRVVGYVQLFIGGCLGVLIAAMTTLWFLGFVVLGTGLGLAYNEEWFGGLLHDYDSVPGMLNFGLSWGVVPFLGAYFVGTEGLSLGVLILSVGVAFDAMRLIWLFEASKPAPYDDVGLPHSRTFDPDVDGLRKEVHRANTFNLVSWVFIAAGLVVLFAA